MVMEETYFPWITPWKPQKVQQQVLFYSVFIEEILIHIWSRQAAGITGADRKLCAGMIYTRENAANAMKVRTDAA